MNPVSVSDVKGTHVQRLQSRFVLWVLLAVVGAGLLAFSQTGIMYDEGFHLLAAQLINAGKRPYVDFFYTHPPLYAYLNAGWMRLFGESWRSAHLLSALLTSASLLLVANFVFSRLPAPGWGSAGAYTAALLMGLHFLVIRFGTLGQAYGLCLFLSVAAFRLAVAAVDQPRGGLAFWAGLAAGGAAASLFSTAPVGPVLVSWLVWQERSGARWKQGAQFLGGWALPFLPLLWLAWQAPRRALFNVVEFHLFYRAPAATTWEVTRHNLGVVTGWLTSPQAFLLGLLAAAGLLFVAGRSEWEARRRSEFYLCAWLAGGLGVYLATLQPTYPHYFVFPVSFLSILAAAGVYAIGSRVWGSGRPGWLVLAVVGLFTVGLAKTAYVHREAWMPLWPAAEEIAREVNRVTPADGLVYADEFVYFTARRRPPPGLESPFARHLPLPPALAASLRVVPESQINDWLAAGRFATVVIGTYELEKVESLGVPRLYARHKRLNNRYITDGYLFWERVAPSPEPR